MNKDEEMWCFEMTQSPDVKPIEMIDCVLCYIYAETEKILKVTPTLKY